MPPYPIPPHPIPSHPIPPHPIPPHPTCAQPLTNPFRWPSSHRSPSAHRPGWSSFPQVRSGSHGSGKGSEQWSSPLAIGPYRRRETPRQGVTAGDYSQFASRLFWELPERCPVFFGSYKRYRGRKKSPSQQTSVLGLAQSKPVELHHLPSARGEIPTLTHGTSPAVTPPRPSPCRNTRPLQPARRARPSPQPQPHRSRWASAWGDPREGTKPLPRAPWPNNIDGERGRCRWHRRR